MHPVISAPWRALSAVLIATAAIVPPSEPHPSVSAVAIESAAPEWTRQGEWGLGRFRESGLTLPPMVITIHDDRSPCNGNAGLFIPREPAEVHLCSSSDAGSRAARMITLHELAHAWAETQLTDEQRAAFLDLRGLDTWIDPDVAPHRWGAEHAAEVVAWGLMDEPIPIIRIDDAEREELAAAFDLLVGRPPLWTPSSPVNPAPCSQRPSPVAALEVSLR